MEIAVLLVVLVLKIGKLQIVQFFVMIHNVEGIHNVMIKVIAFVKRIIILKTSVMCFVQVVILVTVMEVVM
jgi:hypothetical protein